MALDWNDDCSQIDASVETIDHIDLVVGADVLYSSVCVVAIMTNAI